LAVILDRFSRKVVGWALGKTLATRLPLEALHHAITTRQPPPGVVHHSDRGIQGGFKWSSQHLNEGGCDEHSKAAFGSVWAAAPCCHQVDRRWQDEMSDDGSGRRSRQAWRVRMPQARPVCRSR
jgi:hypothetical protein